ncbi:RNase adapter RapZ [Vibrio ruber]|uniref:GlmZ(SRNA)-inactivating NTPase n=1 Tax=Vibrio ruber (strain DSM 16370 / JCM 11486 / BCRC 17186 / CECT 7878 / LMG 23124 / VR1) TaxID=1123498 RepID=A0A1R4LM84_VIBR1|nr:RNase adapter RapZ [Vibrio ruber]WNJ96277.1 RNase adapter RapZ [Vibrio ruber]SJN57690.1 glmZ(sRNA)-inactivating NTPase [Vibrio ruber DSM 16370]
MRLIVVSGQSGAGKSVALRVLEDLGYYCVDNLPIDLLDAFLQSVQGSKQNVAVSIDIRNLPHDPSILSETFRSLKSTVSYDVNVLFLDATEDALLKRYSETRRIHPLSLHNNNLTLAQAIAQEKQILAPLKKQADMLLDSTNKSIHELSETVRMRVEGRERKHLIIVFESFGFKYGLPSDADFVFDVRFLPNPHWQPELRAFTGLDAPVKSFLEQHAEVIDMRQHIQSFIDYWLPSLEKNNRSYLTIAIGCTGGKHRSVYLTQQIGEYFSQLGHQVQIRHTSLEKHHT